MSADSGDDEKGNAGRILELVAAFAKKITPMQQAWVKDHPKATDFELLCAMWAYSQVLARAFPAPSFCMDEDDKKLLFDIANSMVIQTGSSKDVPTAGTKVGLA